MRRWPHYHNVFICTSIAEDARDYLRLTAILNKTRKLQADPPQTPLQKETARRDCTTLLSKLAAQSWVCPAPLKARLLEACG